MSRRNTTTGDYRTHKGSGPIGRMPTTTVCPRPPKRHRMKDRIDIERFMWNFDHFGGQPGRHPHATKSGPGRFG